MTDSMMRQMEWEKIKGDLRAILCTYPSTYDSKKYQQMEDVVGNFIKIVEDNGLNE